jgi:hypothetical protein
MRTMIKRFGYLAKDTEPELGKSHQVYSFPSYMTWAKPGCFHHLPVLTYHNLILTVHFLQVVFDLAEHFSIAL